MGHSLASSTRRNLEIIPGNGRQTTPAVDEPVPFDEFESYVEEYLSDSKIMGIARNTLSERQKTTGLLLRFLRAEGVEVVGRKQLRLYFLHLANGHEKPGGRWGNGRKTDRLPLAASYREQQFARIRGLYHWMIEQDYVTACPLVKSWAPPAKPEQIAPFTDEHLKLIVAAARSTRHAMRDEAIYFTLLGTGLRAAELCSLRMRNLDLSSRMLRVENGKGGKDRTVGIGRKTSKVLREYIRASDVVNKTTGKRLRMPEMPVILSTRETTNGRFMHPVALSNLVRDWGVRAGVKGVRCSPHTFRHTFAVNFLKNKADVRALQLLLGHEDLEMTMRYLKYSEADQINQHHIHDVVDNFDFL